MKKGIITIVFAGLLSLLLLYFLRPEKSVILYEGSSEELLEELRTDTSVVEVYDESGKLLHLKRDTIVEYKQN